MLDETSEFNAKPELEIYADDVKCSHGSALLNVSWFELSTVKRTSDKWVFNGCC